VDSSGITVYYLGKVYHYQKSVLVKKILRDLNLNPEEHLVEVDGKIYTEDRLIKGGNVTIHKVTSAG